MSYSLKIYFVSSVSSLHQNNLTSQIYYTYINNLIEGYELTINGE